MIQLNVRMLLAPVLAVALALLLAGAINSFMIPINGDAGVLGTTTSEPNEGLPTPEPTARPAAMSVGGPVSPFLFIAGAIIVGLLVVVLFFREKGFSKELRD